MDCCSLVARDVAGHIMEFYIRQSKAGPDEGSIMLCRVNGLCVPVDSMGSLADLLFAKHHSEFSPKHYAQVMLSLHTRIVGVVGAGYDKDDLHDHKLYCQPLKCTGAGSGRRAHWNWQDGKYLAYYIGALTRTTRYDSGPM